MARMAFVSSLLMGLLVGAGSLEARTQDKPAEPKPGTFPEVADADDDKARELLDALEKALDGKDEEKIQAALKPMINLRNKKFVGDLKKLLTDKRDEVAALAAHALGSQEDKKIGSLLAKVVTRPKEERGFYSQPKLLAAAIESLGRLGVTGAFDAIEDIARNLLQERQMAAGYTELVQKSCIRYFGITKEKRAVSFLIGHFDEPAPDDPNSGSNPPESYWKARWKLWEVIRPEAVWALKEITGENFETGRRWKAWFEEDGKKAGMK